MIIEVVEPKHMSFQSTMSGDELINMDEYVTRMEEDQNDIYCLTGANTLPEHKYL